MGPGLGVQSSSRHPTDDGDGCVPSVVLHELSPLLPLFPPPAAEEATPPVLLLLTNAEPPLFSDLPSLTKTGTDTLFGEFCNVSFNNNLVCFGILTYLLIIWIIVVGQVLVLKFIIFSSSLRWILNGMNIETISINPNEFNYLNWCLIADLTKYSNNQPINEMFFLKKSCQNDPFLIIQHRN